MKLGFEIFDPAPMENGTDSSPLEMGCRHADGLRCYDRTLECRLTCFADWEKVLETTLQDMFLQREGDQFSVRELCVLDWQLREDHAFWLLFAVKFSAWLFGGVPDSGGMPLGSFHAEATRLVKVTFFEDDGLCLEVEAWKKYPHLFP
jgi:hypothetical protein